MGGRLKKPQYQYDSTGAFLRKFESLTEVNKVFKKTKGNFYENNDYRKMEDGTFMSWYKIGREELKKQERIANCKFCTTSGQKREPVIAYNLLNKKIAAFASISIASEFTKIPKSTIVSQAMHERKHVHHNIYFRYKNKK